MPFLDKHKYVKKIHENLHGSLSDSNKTFGYNNVLKFPIPIKLFNLNMPTMGLMNYA
jgi:hypothetical protein